MKVGELRIFKGKLWRHGIISLNFHASLNSWFFSSFFKWIFVKFLQLFRFSNHKSLKFVPLLISSLNSIAQHLLQFFRVCRKVSYSLAQFLRCHLIFIQHPSERGFIHRNASNFQVLCTRLSEFNRNFLARSVKFFQQRWTDGQQVTTWQLLDFTDIAEWSAHHSCFVAEFLVVIVNARNRNNSWIGGAFVSYTWVLKMKEYFDKIRIFWLKLKKLTFFLYQSKMRPTNGEISVTFASAHATAWEKLNNSVRLQWIPCSLSRILAASIPSHVLASLIKMRSFPIPSVS